MCGMVCGDYISRALAPAVSVSLGLMSNDHRMVDVEFSSDFSCSCKRISFDDAFNCSWSTYDGRPLHSSSSRPLSPLQNFLNHHCTVRSLAVPGPDALLMLQVVSATL